MLASRSDSGCESCAKIVHLFDAQWKQVIHQILITVFDYQTDNENNEL